MTRNNSIFQQQIVQLQTNLHQFALKLTADRDRANDLVQETTLRALDNEERYSHKENFKGWMFTIMRNIFVNDYHRSARQCIMDDDIADTAIKTMTVSTTSEDIFNYGEIAGIISSFPEEYSKPFALYLRGYKYEEIAEMLDTPLGTIKSRIFSLRQRLRALLKDYR